MGKPSRPRHGSMQFWPRKRAAKVLVRIRTWQKSNESKLLGFVGYKVAMAHMTGSDVKGKLTDIYSTPVTIIECPPIKIFSVRFYKNNQLKTEILAPKLDEEVKRCYPVPKNYSKKIDDITDYDSLRVLAYTQTKLTPIGKKKPDIFEVAIGGSKEDQMKWVKENIEKEIPITSVFKENSQIDVHAVTKGRGYQGVIKRFGVPKKGHKSEKGVRRVGSRAGGWCGQAHMMYRVPQPGKTGYNSRTEFNKVILKIGENAENPKGGFKSYGVLKNQYIIVKGSVPGPSKRAVKLTHSIRPNHKFNVSSIKFDKVYYEN